MAAERRNLTDNEHTLLSDLSDEIDDLRASHADYLQQRTDLEDRLQETWARLTELRRERARLIAGLKADRVRAAQIRGATGLSKQRISVIAAADTTSESG